MTRWLSEWLGEWLAFRAHQRNVDRLAVLSDHLLEDIGLRRDQLETLRLRTHEVLPETAGTYNRPVRGRQASRSAASRGVQTSLKGCG